jgi:hypothetical protein
MTCARGRGQPKTSFSRGFRSVRAGLDSVALWLSQDSGAGERQPRFLCLFRVVAYLSRFDT